MSIPQNAKFGVFVIDLILQGVGERFELGFGDFWELFGGEFFLRLHGFDDSQLSPEFRAFDKVGPVTKEKVLEVDVGADDEVIVRQIQVISQEFLRQIARRYYVQGDLRKFGRCFTTSKLVESIFMRSSLILYPDQLSTFSQSSFNRWSQSLASLIHSFIHLSIH